MLLPIPNTLQRKYASWLQAVVSVHSGNSVMYRLSDGRRETHYLKVVRSGWTPSVEAEAHRTLWARDFLPVPEVLTVGGDGEIAWLVTRGIDGLDATHEQFRSDMPTLVTMLAGGLRLFHQTPRASCPFPFGIDDALRVARHRLDHGLIDPVRDFHPEHAHFTAEAAVTELERTRADVEDLVVCHGDYCVPNILISGDRVAGFVDLGELGVADRWWDLAVATWSLSWNFGPGYEMPFLEAYGIEPDNARMRYYRLLYDVVS